MHADTSSNQPVQHGLPNHTDRRPRDGTQVSKRKYIFQQRQRFSMLTLDFTLSMLSEIWDEEGRYHEERVTQMNMSTSVFIFRSISIAYHLEKGQQNHNYIFHHLIHDRYIFQFILEEHLEYNEE